MKIKTIITLLFISQFAFSQSKLDELITERKKIYIIWKEASDKNSGFFGNKTKDDLNNTNIELIKIIRLDNDILDELKNENTKKYLDLQNSYNELSVENATLRNEIKTIKKRLNVEETYGKDNNLIIERIEGDKILFGCLAILFCLLFVYYYVKYSRAKKHIKTLLEQHKK